MSLAAIGAAGVSLAIVAVPSLRMSFEAPSLRVALETGGALVAVATVALLLRQCGLRSRADHLWLTAGLVILAATSLTVAALIVADVWSAREAHYAMGWNLAGTIMLAIAAFAPSRQLRIRRRTLFAGAALLAVAVAALATLLVGVGPKTAVQPENGRTAVQIATALAMGAAAAGLTRRNDPLLRWVAASVALAGIAKFDYALFPRDGADNVHLGDVLRVLGWAVLLAGVAGEMLKRRHQASIEDERRRIARELHDGVAQELAFIRRRAGRLAELPGGLDITAAADRALEEYRRAMEALVPASNEPLEDALKRLGARLARECEIEVQVNVRDAIVVTAKVRAELFRIISEAVRNAATHGGATRVRVELAGNPLMVHIADNGKGFRDGANTGRGVAGYGLIAMRERAEQVGGEFSYETIRGAGTRVRVVLP